MRCLSHGSLSVPGSRQWIDSGDGSGQASWFRKSGDSGTDSNAPTREHTHAAVHTPLTAVLDIRTARSAHLKIGGSCRRWR